MSDMSDKWKFSEDFQPLPTELLVRLVEVFAHQLLKEQRMSNNHDGLMGPQIFADRIS